VVLTDLSEATLKGLNAVLPPHWSHGNPVDIIGDATVERLVAATSAVMDDPNFDATLVLFCPQHVTRARDAAQAIIPLGRLSKKPFLTAWLGEGEIAECRVLFDAAGVPNFYTPESAVEAFSFLVAFRHNQALLLESAPPLSPLPAPDTAYALALREKVLAEGRTILSEFESKTLLRAFHIPVPEQIIATSKEAALAAGERIGYPLVIKIHSPDITHKSDVGGVRLNLQNSRMLAAAYEDMLAQVHYLRPEAHVEGVIVQPMLRYPNTRELLVGVSTDPVFGPVIMFGSGGVAVEALRDMAVALPPLNRRLASELIEQTRVARLLKSYRGLAPVDYEALITLLLQVSTLTCLLPWVKEMDLNPVLAHAAGVMVADARIVIDPQRDLLPVRYRHMAIHPYPAELEANVTLPDGEVILVRPIKPEDAGIEQNFMGKLSDNSRYMRFMHYLTELSPAMLARFTQLDYDREMALIALTGSGAGQEIIGVARYHPNPDRFSAEYAAAVGDAWQGRGVGHLLMTRLIECARAAGYRELTGTVLTVNSAMLEMAHNLGFKTSSQPEDGTTVRAVLTL
jgi:acetyltransferase